MLLTAPGAKDSISGVIFYDETLRQKNKEGVPFAEYLAKQGIIPGIKVDMGAKPLAGFPGETITEGLDGLRERLIEYHELGARFAKWRAVIDIAEGIPTRFAIEANAHALARYAALCQEQNIVPIVEPEVLMDGGHDIERCEEVTGRVLETVFDQLFGHRIYLEGVAPSLRSTMPSGSRFQSLLWDGTVHLRHKVMIQLTLNPPRVRRCAGFLLSFACASGADVGGIYVHASTCVRGFRHHCCSAACCARNRDHNAQRRGARRRITHYLHRPAMLCCRGTGRALVDGAKRRRQSAVLASGGRARIIRDSNMPGSIHGPMVVEIPISPDHGDCGSVPGTHQATDRNAYEMMCLAMRLTPHGHGRHLKK